ncbi:MAG: elongation factor P hydroxylase [Gammaproteobacteria bacterium]|nr:elongation factor P hydroxylase [Gammaproteobacteria bacterium]NVK86892.1 elongation factor P hydroxylase [Gammaproteobacteria bacterium]
MSLTPAAERAKLEQLQSVFSDLFLSTYNTRLETGADEPFYQAATDRHEAVIYSRNDYLSSALHEIAHWCIAGPERRLLDDYGYWYHADGRDQSAQHAFEQVEVKPQAVEWALSMALDHPFNLSADNLEQGSAPSPAFSAAVTLQLQRYLTIGLPPRAQQLYDALVALSTAQAAQFRAAPESNERVPC